MIKKVGEFKLDSYLNPDTKFDDLDVLDNRQKKILKYQDNLEITERSLDKINELLHSIASVMSAIENQDYVAMYLFGEREQDDHQYFKDLSNHCRSRAMRLYDIKKKLREDKYISRKKLRQLIIEIALSEKKKRKKRKKKKVNYKKAYKKYHSSKKAKRERAQRNAAGRKLKKLGIKIPDGYEIDHKNAIAYGGSNDMSNLRLIPRGKNRALGQKITTQKRKKKGNY